MADVFFDSPRRSVLAHNEHALRETVWNSYEMQVHSASHNIRYQHDVRRGTDFAIGRVKLIGDLIAESRPLPFVCVIQVESGRQTVTSHGTATGREDRTPYLFPRGTRKHLAWQDVELSQIVLRAATVDQELARRNLRPLRELTLGPNPLTSRAALSWNDAAAHARATAASDYFARSSLVQASVSSLLVTAFVETFISPGHRSAQGAIPHGNSPKSVRLALEFIEAHAAERLTVADIAHHARVSERGLQAAFMRHLHQRPLQAVRATRLERARTDLLDADPDNTTVVEIATRWGFSHGGRFASHYLQRFGERPSDTLHR